MGDPIDYTYYGELGKGAFGQIRKCSLNKKEAENKLTIKLIECPEEADPTENLEQIVSSEMNDITYKF